MISVDSVEDSLMFIIYIIILYFMYISCLLIGEGACANLFYHMAEGDNLVYHMP